MATSTNGPVATDRVLLRSALAQFREECLLYNRAVGSYNTHLDNHRDRRDLHDIPYRSPPTAHDVFEAALAGHRHAIAALLEHLLEEVHLDSQVRTHPRTYPVHEEAVAQLAMARDELVSTLEEALQHADGPR